MEIDLTARRIGGADHREFDLALALTVEPGRTLALVGPNGAGKSTALAVLAGLLPPTSGFIRLGPRLLDEPAKGIHVRPEWRNIGVVFQDYRLFGHMSARDNVAFGLRRRGLRRRQATERSERWLERMGLAAVGDHRPARLSGGQAQRVALARALACEPDLLLLDEPLAALDVATAATTRRMLAEHMTEFAGPRILVSHDPSDAMALADEVCVLENGRVTQRSTPDELRRRPATPYIAALAGLNLLVGRGDGRGDIRVTADGDAGGDGHNDFVLRCAESVDGPVRAVIDPRAVSLYRQRPDGSPRNSWTTAIAWIEPLGEVCRVGLAGPLPLMVDITTAAAEALMLRTGDEVWASVKATEIAVTRIGDAG